MAYLNVRRLGEIGPVEEPERFVEERGLGPDALDRDQVEALHHQTRRVLEAAIDARGRDFAGWFLLPHRGGDMRCPECGRGLETTEVSGRTTYFCPRRQGKSP